MCVCVRVFFLFYFFEISLEKNDFSGRFTKLLFWAFPGISSIDPKWPWFWRLLWLLSGMAELQRPSWNPKWAPLKRPNGSHGLSRSPTPTETLMPLIISSLIWKCQLKALTGNLSGPMKTSPIIVLKWHTLITGISANVKLLNLVPFSVFNRQTMQTDLRLAFPMTQLPYVGIFSSAIYFAIAWFLMSDDSSLSSSLWRNFLAILHLNSAVVTSQRRTILPNNNTTIIIITSNDTGRGLGEEEVEEWCGEGRWII